MACRMLSSSYLQRNVINLSVRSMGNTHFIDITYHNNGSGKQKQDLD